MNQTSQIPPVIMTDNKRSFSSSSTSSDTAKEPSFVQRRNKRRRTEPSPQLNVAELWKVAYDAVRPSAVDRTPKHKDPVKAKARGETTIDKKQHAQQSSVPGDEVATPLPIQTATILNLEEQHALIQSSRNKLVVLFFTAKWCRSCRFIQPIWKKLIQDNPESVAFAKVDVDTASQSYLDEEHHITSMPTFVFYKGSCDKPVHRFTGADPYSLFCKVNQYKRALVMEEEEDCARRSNI